VVAACAGTGGVSGADYFEVTDFQLGKMRENHLGLWEVYEPGAHMRYEVNGACEYDDVAYPCMWYGTVIRYRTNRDELVLDCEAHTSEKLDWGNPAAAEAEQSYSFAFTMTFRGDDTVKRVPSYIIASSGNPAADEATFVCLHQGREVLNYTLLVTYGESGENPPPRLAFAPLRVAGVH
jgi:hypothetical protein